MLNFERFEIAFQRKTYEKSGYPAEYVESNDEIVIVKMKKKVEPIQPVYTSSEAVGEYI